jgi:hypothetical protein
MENKIRKSILTHEQQEFIIKNSKQYTIMQIKKKLIACCLNNMKIICGLQKKMQYKFYNKYETRTNRI